MPAIRVVCRGCGREVNSAEVDRDVRCTLCVARQVIGPSLRRYQELWAKRTRYRRARAPHAALEHQMGRLATRMARRLHERIRDQKLAADVLNQALSEARQQADSIGGRVLVPRVGQEIVGGGARA